MTIIIKIMGILSIIMLISTMVCGLWIKNHPQEDMQFHMVFSLLTVIIALITIVLFMIRR